MTMRHLQNTKQYFKNIPNKYGQMFVNVKQNNLSLFGLMLYCCGSVVSFCMVILIIEKAIGDIVLISCSHLYMVDSYNIYLYYIYNTFIFRFPKIFMHKLCAFDNKQLLKKTKKLY